ncbi:MAG TPA: hypothetical protein PJ982_14140 [Lacipirellulaceae bacterium]|nr:hypothetical protein [Lacipirellulaceae bacterium]
MNDNPVVYVVDDDDHARKAVMALVAAMDIENLGFASAEEFLSSYNCERPG